MQPHGLPPLKHAARLRTNLCTLDTMQASDSARVRFRAARGSPSLTSADAEYGQEPPPTPFELEVLEGALMVATGAPARLGIRCHVCLHCVHPTHTPW